EEFEAANNTVELHLHLAPFYKMVNGVLQPVSREPSGSINLSFDRRKTVGDLRITIYHVLFVVPQSKVELNGNQCCSLSFVLFWAKTLSRRGKMGSNVKITAQVLKKWVQDCKGKQEGSLAAQLLGRRATHDYVDSLSGKCPQGITGVLFCFLSKTVSPCSGNDENYRTFNSFLHRKTNQGGVMFSLIFIKY
ncbi:hypothetical protein GOODEAATRI_012244, partial [Goodea atripinnis]